MINNSTTKNLWNQNQNGNNFVAHRETFDSTNGNPDQYDLGFFDRVSDNRLRAEKQIDFIRLWNQFESIKAKNETTTELIKLYDEFKQIIARVQRKEGFADYGLVHTIILKKFPPEVREVLFREIRTDYNGVWNLEIIMTITENHLMATAICEETDKAVVNAKVNAITKKSRGSKKSRCIYCKQNKHDFLQCRSSYEARAKVIIDEKRCKNCLSTNHTVDQCRSRTCRACNTSRITL